MYTCALHTPALNANLISISSFDRAGLTTTFANGHGIMQKSDGTLVLAGKHVNGMYLLETIDNIPLTMNSMSQPTSLEQWHCWLTHCSPLTIQEMATKQLVNGLKLSEKGVTGKCENCILGRQTLIRLKMRWMQLSDFEKLLNQPQTLIFLFICK
jgi:GAG-pre-integrase domain